MIQKVAAPLYAGPRTPFLTYSVVLGLGLTIEVKPAERDRFVALRQPTGTTGAGAPACYLPTDPPNLQLRCYRIFPLSSAHLFHIPTDYLPLDYSCAYDFYTKTFSDKLFCVEKSFDPPPYTQKNRPKSRRCSYFKKFDRFLPADLQRT